MNHRSQNSLLLGFLLVLLSPLGLNAQQIFEIPELVAPKSVAVNQDALFITTEDHEVLVYSLEPFVLRSRCAGSGEGIGTFQHPPRVIALQRGALAHDFRKSMLVDGEGACSSEIEYADIPWFDPNMEMQLIPVGANYVRTWVDHDLERYYVDLLSPQLERITRLHEGSWDWSMFSKYTPNRLSMLHHYIDVRVDDGRIYVADTNRGFFISVFSSSGNLERTIDLSAEMRNIPVTETYKAESEGQARTSLEGFLRSDQEYSFVFPEFFPAIHYFHVSGGQIYLMTYRERGGSHELLVLDPHGQKLGSIYLPLPSANYLFPSSLPLELNTVFEGELFELVNPMGSENWELHISDVG